MKQKNLMWIGVAILIVIVTPVLGIVSWLHYLNGGDNPNDIPASQRPVLNPHPQYFMTVKGHIDPALLNKLKVTWSLGYSTTNPKCEVTVNRFAGVSAERDLTENYQVKPGPDGSYHLKLPLDKYLPGHCGWELGAIGYAYHYGSYKYIGNSESTVGFNYNGITKKTVINQIVLCGPSKCQLSKNSEAAFQDQLSLTSSPKAIVNFTKNKGVQDDMRH